MDWYASNHNMPKCFYSSKHCHISYSCFIIKYYQNNMKLILKDQMYFTKDKRLKNSLGTKVYNIDLWCKCALLSEI